MHKGYFKIYTTTYTTNARYFILSVYLCTQELLLGALYVLNTEKFIISLPGSEYEQLKPKKMSKKFKGGIFNPLHSNKAHFDYEVVEYGEVEIVEYEDRGVVDSYPQRPLLIKTTGGGDWSNDFFYGIAIMDDALKELREGEIISANLSFSVEKNQDGKYQQKVTIRDIFTLNDYFQIREAEAFYKGSITSDKKSQTNRISSWASTMGLMRGV